MEPNSSPTDIFPRIEMGGYDSLEQLQQVWDTRCPNDSAPMTNKDANNADA